MDENEVIENLCKHLERKGWSILNRVRAGAPGVDIVAERIDGTKFFIEAKGGTSSRQGSRRHGKPYTQSQVFDVTSKGLMQCFHHIASQSNNVSVGFAYPDGKFFRKYLEPIMVLMASIGVWFFCVKEDGTVKESIGFPPAK